MAIEGSYCDGRTARVVAAVLEVRDDKVWLADAFGMPLIEAMPVAMAKVPSRLGSTPRFILLGDDGQFETADNDGVDALFGVHAEGGWVHRLESDRGIAAAALVVLVGAIAVFVVWGMPALAQMIASNMPPAMSRQADTTALAALDRTALSPSRLPPERIAQILERLDPLIEAASKDAIVNVHFRHAAPSIGANALTLPAGTIIVTDQLVALAEDDEEIAAVVAHEIGHAAHHHGMRSALQASGLGLLTLVLVGDVSTVSNAATALPAMLTELGYSRGFEREADDYATVMLQRLHIPSHRLGDILQRMSKGHEDGPGYLSTHPPTRERVERLRDR